MLQQTYKYNEYRNLHFYYPNYHIKTAYIYLIMPINISLSDKQK